MKKVMRSHLVLFWILFAASLICGFLAWPILIVVAFTGGFVLDQNRTAKSPAVLAALAVTASWLIVAFIRDTFEGFRISSRVASFLSLPHASFAYFVILIISFLPALFAALSGAQVSRSKKARQSSPASGR